MKIIYNKNPLYTSIELDDMEKMELWYKCKIDYLENIISAGRVYLSSTKLYDVEKAKNALDIKYDDNGGSHLDIECDKLIEWYLIELTGSHMGDCTCNAFSCMKCQAETLIGIDTIKGLGKHSAYKINAAFGDKNEKTIDDALSYLKNYDCTPPDLTKWDKLGGYEKYIPRWKAEALQAYEWLLQYKTEHFGEII